MPLCIYVDGKFTHNKEEAVASIYDHGFLYGDGIFEGIRAYHGRIFKHELHIKRLYESAKSINLKIPVSQEEMRALTIETVRRTGYQDAYIRLVVSRGIGDLGLDPNKCPKPSIFIIADAIALYPPEKYENGLKVITCSTRRNRPDCVNAQIKSLNYLNNVYGKMEVTRAGADEGIMLNDVGYVTEATADNLFIVKGRRLITPPTYMGILEGITRNCVMELGAEIGLTVVESGLLMHDIYNADECFLTGSAAELIPVVEADDRQIADGKPGPIFRKLLELFRELTKTDGDPVYE